MQYHIVHKTEYIYEEPANLCYNEARLVPRTFAHQMFQQTCLDNQIKVDPLWSDYRERTDFFGNHVLFYTVGQPHQQTVVTATSHVKVEPVIGAEGAARADRLQETAGHSPAWESVRQRLQTDLNPDLVEARQFVMDSPLVTVFPELVRYAAPSFPNGRPILEAAYDLMQRIYQEFDFVPGVTTITTPLGEVLQQRRGVCQDYAHLMVGCLRARGLAARYVSGYIETLSPPDQEKLEGADASHAWCSVFFPDAGWIDFDPTNNLVPKDQHITLAWGRDFSDITPLKGVVFSNGKHQLQVSVNVERQEHDED